jgi:hypothetical protein
VRPFTFIRPATIALRESAREATPKRDATRSRVILDFMGIGREQVKSQNVRGKSSSIMHFVGSAGFQFPAFINFHFSRSNAGDKFPSLTFAL